MVKNRVYFANAYAYFAHVRLDEDINATYLELMGEGDTRKRRNERTRRVVSERIGLLDAIAKAINEE